MRLGASCHHKSRDLSDCSWDYSYLQSQAEVFMEVFNNSLSCIINYPPLVNSEPTAAIIKLYCLCWKSSDKPHSDVHWCNVMETFTVLQKSPYTPGARRSLETKAFVCWKLPLLEMSSCWEEFTVYHPPNTWEACCTLWISWEPVQSRQAEWSMGICNVKLVDLPVGTPRGGMVPQR